MNLSGGKVKRQLRVFLERGNPGGGDGALSVKRLKNNSSVCEKLPIVHVTVRKAVSSQEKLTGNAVNALKDHLAA